MGRWTSDEHGCIYDEAGCFARLSPNKAERLATRHNADIAALTAERDAAIDEKLFWVDKYAYEMEKSDRRRDQWERCFRLAFGLKNKYHSKLRTLAAEVDELRGKLAIMEEDMCAAAGELLVPFPQPGSIDAKLLIANRLLKGEIAELRGKLDDVRMGIGCARGQRSTQFCAEAAQRDAVITKLLDLTAPHVDEFGNRQWWQYKRPEQMHARACEIAGRTE